MTAIEILDEAIPRSQATVEACRAEIAKKTKRLANGLAIGFAAFTTAMVLIFGIIELATDPTFDLPRGLQSAAGIEFFGAVLPAWILRKLILRGVEKAARTAREGVAHRASIVRRVVGPSLIPLIELAWSENGQQVTARFPLTNENEIADPDRLVVLARPNHKLVLGVFADCGYYTGSRVRPARSQATSSRSP